VKEEVSMHVAKLLLVALVVSSLVVLGLFSRREYVVPADQIGDFTAVELPLVFAGSHQRLVYVSVPVQGVSLRLMVDTGHFAPLSINSDVLDCLDVELTARRLHRDMRGNTYVVREFVLPTLSLGTLDLSNVPGVENVTSPPGFDGTIGLGLLRHFNLLFDYRGERLTLFRKDRHPEELTENGWYRCPYGLSSCFGVAVDGIDEGYEIGLDSGSSHTTVDADSRLGRALRTSLGEDARYQVVDDTGETLFVYPNVRFLLGGEFDLGPSTCVVMELDPPTGDGLMGYDFFWNNAVFVDYGAGEMWLRPAESSESPSPAAKCRTPTRCSTPCELPGISSLRHARNKPLPGGSFMTFLLENSSSNPKAKPMKFEGHKPYFRNSRAIDPISGGSFLSAACLPFGPVCVRTRTGREELW